LIAGATSEGTSFGGSAENLTQIASNVKAVAMVLSVVPILCIYPFVQKYFVTGVMLGSVKQ
jgi:putative aldouronate transport system permease protein